MKSAVPVLLLSDDQSDIEEIWQHISPIFTNRGTASNPEEGRRFLVGKGSCLVALCFDTMELARQCYLELEQQYLDQHPLPHRVLLLCASREAGKACSAALHGTFDDFAVLKPVTDPCVLRFRSYRLARELEAEDRLRRKGREQTAMHARRYTDQVLDDMAEGQAKLRSRIEQGHGMLEQQVARSMADLASQLDHPEYSDAVEVLDRDKLSGRLRDGVSAELAAELAHFKKDVSESIEGLLARYQSVRAEVNASIDGLAPAAPTLSALVVDDDRFFNDFVKEMLQQENIEVQQAFDGDGAFAQAIERPPDLLLIDVNLPGINGIDLSRRLREQERLRDTPIIIITGHASRLVVESSSRAGVNEFLVKPFSQELLRQKIAKVLARR